MLALVIFKFYSTALRTTPNTIIIEIQCREKNALVLNPKLSVFVMKKTPVGF